ncbi:MAG: hypothetical protein R3E10_01195 [Gemmatimonadota bacterium]
MAELTDKELDAMILARLKDVGVDLSVLPENDRDAPADRRRILSSARRFLKSTPAAIRALQMDTQAVPPILYPSTDFGQTEGRGR